MNWYFGEMVLEKQCWYLHDYECLYHNRVRWGELHLKQAIFAILQRYI